MFLVARGGLATKTPKSLIYIGFNHKIATNRCSTCLEHLMAYFGINFSEMPVLGFWYWLPRQRQPHFLQIVADSCRTLNSKMLFKK